MADAEFLIRLFSVRCRCGLWGPSESSTQASIDTVKARGWRHIGSRWFCRACLKRRKKDPARTSGLPRSQR